MGALASILSAVLVTDIGVFIARLKRNGIFWAIIGLFLLTTYVFALVAGTLYLATRTTTLNATLIMAGGSFALVLIFLCIMYSLDARDKRVIADRKSKKQLQTNIAVATSLTLLRRKPLLAAGAAVGVGLAMSFLKKSGSR